MRNTTKLTPHEQTTMLGGYVEFSCISDGEVTWYFNEGDLPSNVQAGSNYLKSTYWIRISDVQLHNEGTYTCYGDTKYFTSESKHHHRDYFYDESVHNLKRK